MYYRLMLGVVLLALTLLNIGPFWTDQEQTTPASPMFRLLDEPYYLPLLFLISLTAALVDFVSKNHSQYVLHGLTLTVESAEHVLMETTS